MARDWYYRYGNTIMGRFLNNSTAKDEGEMVNLASNVMAKCADTNTTGCLGVTAAAIAADAYGWVYLNGVFEGVAASGVDFAVGAAAYSTGTVGEADAGSQNDKSIGNTEYSDPASAGTIYVRIVSTQLLQTTHA